MAGTGAHQRSLVVAAAREPDDDARDRGFPRLVFFGLHPGARAAVESWKRLLAADRGAGNLGIDGVVSPAPARQHMNRLLTLAQFLFGEKVRWSVFEPLVADRDREVRANRSMALRLRWWCAIAAALATCVPRATLGRLPSSLVLDLGKRALIFATLAYAVQWVDAILTTRRGEGGVPPSIATTAPFLMIPVIWRIRVSSIPRHQQRLLAAAFAATCITVSAGGAETWLVWSGYGASIAWLTVCGWHLAEPVVAEKYPQVTKEGYRLILLTF